MKAKIGILILCGAAPVLASCAGMKAMPYSFDKTARLRQFLLNRGILECIWFIMQARRSLPRRMAHGGTRYYSLRGGSLK